MLGPREVDARNSFLLAQIAKLESDVDPELIVMRRKETVGPRR